VSERDRERVRDTASNARRLEMLKKASGRELTTGYDDWV
jgi:hypothetical protein